MMPLHCILTTGAEQMAKTDPHGWTLSLISISVVFIALMILFCIYQLIGDINTGKFKRSPRQCRTTADHETAAVIALALREELCADHEAAIALALHLYLEGQVHDSESGIITIRHPKSAWDDKKLNFRKYERI